MITPPNLIAMADCCDYSLKSNIGAASQRERVEFIRRALAIGSQSITDAELTSLQHGIDRWLKHDDAVTWAKILQALNRTLPEKRAMTPEALREFVVNRVSADEVAAWFGCTPNLAAIALREAIAP